MVTYNIPTYQGEGEGEGQRQAGGEGVILTWTISSEIVLAMGRGEDSLDILEVELIDFTDELM